MSEPDPKAYPMARAVREAYLRGEEDEALEPLVLVDGASGPVGRIKPGDSAIFYDIRGEREIELTRSLTERGFTHFPVEPLDLDFVTMIRYAPSLAVRVAFPPEEEISGTLSEVVSAAGLRQLKVCESEKEVHVGFFFNGKRTGFFPGEERVVALSPRDAGDYSGVPELSAAAVADEAIKALEAETYAFIVVNFANVDVVAHCEKRESVIRAVETADRELGRVLAAARGHGVTSVVTADHGTAEKWYYPDGAIDTGHTDSPVPCIVAPPEGFPPLPSMAAEGTLADVAPTVLSLLGIPAPERMTGKSLLGRVPEEMAGPVLLVIMDGWGLGSDPARDLIRAARTPVMDRLESRYAMARLAASGEAVGMPPKTVGNSESGHLHLGAGRVVAADRVRIDAALADGSFAANDAFLACMRGAKSRGAALHLLGIISFYSSHGSLRHLFALLDLARRVGLPEVYVHGFLGRRGERPESGALYTAQTEARVREIGLGRVVSILGRFWSLDREENWDRIEKTWRLLVRGEGRPVSA